MAQLLEFLKQNENTRKIFGKRELKIIEKQLEGIQLTQSEKNRLSRDIRKKFEFIRDVSKFNDKFSLKKGQKIKSTVNNAVEEILNDELGTLVREIWLFGSTVDNSRTFRSDIDLVVHFKTKLTKREAFKFRVRVAGRVPDSVDIQVFEFLPEKVQKTILKNHKVLLKNERKNQ